MPITPDDERTPISNTNSGMRLPCWLSGMCLECVNAIVPGTIDTPMNAVLFSDPEMRKRFAGIAPARRLGTPADLAGIAVFLASEDSSYCVGGLFTVDGGLTAV